MLCLRRYRVMDKMNEIFGKVPAVPNAAGIFSRSFFGQELAWSPSAPPCSWTRVLSGPESEESWLWSPYTPPWSWSLILIRDPGPESWLWSTSAPPWSWSVILDPRAGFGHPSTPPLQTSLPLLPRPPWVPAAPPPPPTALLPITHLCLFSGRSRKKLGLILSPIFPPEH